MIKVLAQSTNSAVPFWTKKGGTLSAKTSQKFGLVCMRVLAFTSSTSRLLSFVYRKDYLAKMNNLSDHHGAGPNTASSDAPA